MDRDIWRAAVHGVLSAALGFLAGHRISLVVASRGYSLVAEQRP